MSTNVGMWIDHRKAVIVNFSDYGEAMIEVESHLEKHLGEPLGIEGGSHSRTQFGPHERFPDDSAERHHKVHLNRYYDEVIANIADADSIMIFGPGEAKNELKKRFESKTRKGEIVRCETADKMSARQISAKARLFFKKRKFLGRNPRQNLRANVAGSFKPPRR